MSNLPDLLGTEKKLQRPSRLAPVLIALACSVLLTGGSIYGVVATCSWSGSSKPITGVFFWMAVASLLAVAVCLLWLIILVAIRIFGVKKEL